MNLGAFTIMLNIKMAIESMTESCDVILYCLRFTLTDQTSALGGPGGLHNPAFRCNYYIKCVILEGDEDCLHQLGKLRQGKLSTSSKVR